MASRKRLKGIALGLLGTFVGRNNDIDGYWGMGKLRRFAETNGQNEITLDLLSSFEQPGFVSSFFKSVSPVTIAGRFYRDWLERTAPKFGVRFRDIAEATINIKFTTFEEFPDVTRDTRGFPYICNITLRGNNGSHYSAVKVGVCGPHDSNKESRRVQY